LGVLVFVQTGLGALKLRLEVQKLRDERKATARDPEPKQPSKPPRKPRPEEQTYYRGAVIRWLLVAIFVFLTGLSYLYLRADVARRQAEIARSQAEVARKEAEYNSYQRHTLEQRNQSLTQQLEEAHALLKRNNIPTPGGQ
jgi:uncharacterized protein HemX